MNNQSYSPDYFPPAPVLPVRIAIQDESSERNSIPALVDTGSDGTFVPTHLLEQMQSPPAFLTNVRSHLGNRTHRVAIHIVDIILFDQIRIPGVEVVSDDWGDRVILGRNILNKLHISLDGPSQIIQLLDRI
jgi:predicted aspartyl protease